MSVTAMFPAATHTLLKREGHDVSLSESIHRTSKAASSFPPQRPAEVRVKVEEPSFGSIATRQENQVGGDLEYRFLFWLISDLIGPERKYETSDVPVCTAHCHVFSSAA
jgi:hypothetical protein